MTQSYENPLSIKLDEMLARLTNENSLIELRRYLIDTISSANLDPYSRKDWLLETFRVSEQDIRAEEIPHMANVVRYIDISGDAAEFGGAVVDRVISFGDAEPVFLIIKKVQEIRSVDSEKHSLFDVIERNLVDIS